MKKIFITFIFLFFGIIVLNAQTLTDYNKNFTHKVEYDNYFNPTLKLTLKNISAKTITSVEVTVYYEDDSYDWNKPTRVYVGTTNIPPRNSNTMSYRVEKEIDYRKPKEFMITRIRYSDRTICDKF